MTEKIVIGLTGNIATGKSLVLRMLQELGSTVIDADKLVHQLMQPGTPVHQEIVSKFGNFILDESGQINRGRLGQIAFTMPEAMTQLEAITHPAVRENILASIEQATTSVVVIEAIKLFESGLADECESNWVVVAPPELQLKRLVERRKMSTEEAQQRIKAQSSQKEKVDKADVVINNSGELVKTWGVVKKHFTELIDAHKHPAPQVEPATAAADSSSADPGDITIRRAKREDLDAMATLINTGTSGSIALDLSDMMELLFSRAYIVALAGSEILVIAGWQTENLIAGLQDFYVARPELWPTVGKQMLDMIHEEIDNLSCEVSIVFILNQAGDSPIEFFKSQEYEQSESKSLGYMWKDAAEEWQPADSVLLFKKLREQRIMVPM
ncbi:MAG: dephospho-CoA kinase [Chloroflexota bacterium]